MTAMLEKFTADCSVIANALDEVTELRATKDRQGKRILALMMAMEHVIAELEEDFDINDHGGPNKAMRLASELNEAIYGPGGF